MISTNRAVIYTILLIIFVVISAPIILYAVIIATKVIVPFIFSFENKLITIALLVFIIVVIGFLGAFVNIAQTGISPAKAFRKYYFFTKKQDDLNNRKTN